MVARSPPCPRPSPGLVYGRASPGPFRIPGPAAAASGSNTHTRAKLHDREGFTTPYSSKSFVIMENGKIPRRRPANACSSQPTAPRVGQGRRLEAIRHHISYNYDLFTRDHDRGPHPGRIATCT